MVASVKLSSQGDGGHNMLDGLDESYGQNAGMGNDQAFGEYSVKAGGRIRRNAVVNYHVSGIASSTRTPADLICQEAPSIRIKASLQLRIIYRAPRENPRN